MNGKSLRSLSLCLFSEREFAKQSVVLFAKIFEFVEQRDKERSSWLPFNLPDDGQLAIDYWRSLPFRLQSMAIHLNKNSLIFFDAFGTAFFQKFLQSSFPRDESLDRSSSEFDLMFELQTNQTQQISQTNRIDQFKHVKRKSFYRKPFLASCRPFKV